jgi:hypothetical protein
VSDIFISCARSTAKQAAAVAEALRSPERRRLSIKSISATLRL